MNAAEKIEKLIKKFYMAKKSYVTTSREMDKRVLDNAWSAYEKSKKTKSAQAQPIVWRAIMKKPITKFAAAAVIMLVVVLSITFLDNAVTPAYAIEQTIQASHSVRYLHIRNSVVSQDEPMEFWVEFDASGQLKNMRFNKPAWMDPGDGTTVLVWKNNKAQLWIEKKNFLVTLKDTQIADNAIQAVEQMDPKLAVERLKREQEEGGIELTIEEPANKVEPIVVTATSTKEDDNSPFQRMVLFVDQATRLVNSAELYKLEAGEYQKVITVEYFDYNQPIASEMFTLDNIPSDAMRMDQTTQEVGLAQGDLTDEEMGVELIRQFLQALIERDYAEAGKLWGGVPAERMEKAYGQIRFIRIISIGEPVPHSVTGGLYVPCTVEIEENGKISQWQPEHSYVRQVHGQPERWEIIGGFRGI